MSEPSQITAGRRKAAFVFVFISVVIDILALGVTIPVLPKLILEFEGGDTASAAAYTGLFISVWGLTQFFAAPVLGMLSDRFGRRPVILISSLGLGLDYFLVAWAPTLLWLLVGRILAGMTSAAYATANAYIADTAPPEKRAAQFGMLGASFGLGFVAGPAVGGLLGSIDLRLPFWAAGTLCLLNTAYGFFILPESLPREKRSTFSLQKANPLGSLRLLRSHRLLIGLATASTFSFLAHESLPSVFVLYTDYRYGWDEKTIGLVLALVGIASVIVQGGLIGPAVKRFGEKRCLLAGYGLGAIGFAIYGLAPTGGLFQIGIAFTALWGLASAATTALMTARVDANAQGQLQGAISSLRSLTGIVGPLIFTQIFAMGVGQDGATPAPAVIDALIGPGAAFLLSAGLILAALAISAKVLMTFSTSPKVAQ